MADPKRGPYSTEELLNLWFSFVDSSYSDPLVEIGDGSGLEIVGATAEQLSRVSEAVDRTMESMFLLPWSGQTDEPASGRTYAAVLLTVERTVRTDVVITFAAGDVLVEEVQTDYGETGGVEQPTGRRFVLVDDLTFLPGETGPAVVPALAEVEGYGHNNPAEETITLIYQPGAGLQNDLATVWAGPSTDLLRCGEDPDVVVQQNVGQYVEFTVGANTGQVRRAVGYSSPEPGVHGGVLSLARTALFHLAAVPGSFIPGEDVVQAVTGATGVFVAASSSHLAIEKAQAGFDSANVITGATSGATATPDAILQAPGLATETRSAGWKVLDWHDDLGVTITNVESPTGGLHAMLDELGSERNVPRSPGEDDETYRKRVATLPDVVSPNAIRRVVNRIIAQYGARACLREVGLPLFRGFFYDGDPDSADPAIAFAYDFDFTVRPEDRFKVMLDRERSRAYFEVGVPKLGFGEFGFAYDDGAANAYDSAPYLTFYDGFPVTAAIIYRNIWQAVRDAKAAGVGFDLYIEDVGCA